jgi:hypothetical protein
MGDSAASAKQRERHMDFGGFNWILLDIVGPAILLAVIAWALLRNRRSRRSDAESEAATRRLYDEEERDRASESDGVP